MSLLIRLPLFAALLLASGSAASAPPASDDWPVADPASHGLDASKLSALDAAIKGGQAPDTTSVLVVHRGALVHEAYFNGADRSSLHNTRSLTKSVTAMLVGAAI
ncbi:MAG: serine hydrolase, partial [Stenotrophomonas sp.]